MNELETQMKKQHKCNQIIPTLIAILKHIIKLSSDENNIILDLFMDVALTTIITIERNRRIIGIEIDDAYYETCEKRILETVRHDQNISNYPLSEVL